LLDQPLRRIKPEGQMTNRNRPMLRPDAHNPGRCERLLLDDQNRKIPSDCPNFLSEWRIPAIFT
jgi:hypothetical protein